MAKKEGGSRPSCHKVSKGLELGFAKKKQDFARPKFEGGGEFETPENFETKERKAITFYQEVIGGLFPVVVGVAVATARLRLFRKTIVHYRLMTLEIGMTCDKLN